tara:strand:+ start:3626 stop:4792 length:1167 start_codon:yes stop_codon:yes gene_type:complete
MFKKNIYFKNYLSKEKKSLNSRVFKIYQRLIREKSALLLSLGKNYKDAYSKKLINNLKKINNFCIIGMGGSILGTKAIYNFLRPKKKIFTFIDNLSDMALKDDSKKKAILIVSKSGETLETILNSNFLIKNKNKNIFITENKNSYLLNLANQLKSDVIHHNNFIGGRYSILSEVGMLPAQLMGYKPENFRRFNQLVSNKQFMNTLVNNVSSIFDLISKKKTNSIILNYDDKSNDFFHWYQQLVAESLGKKGKGIMPIISVMPKDNHSLMQYYLDGKRNNFFTLFFVKENKSKRVKKNDLMRSHNYLFNKTINEILFSQFNATEKVFNQNRIPFRSIVLKNRSPQNIGELFIFFILETLLLGKLMKINPFNQPAVELLKTQTKKNLLSQ